MGWGATGSCVNPLIRVATDRTGVFLAPSQSKCWKSWNTPRISKYLLPLHGLIHGSRSFGARFLLGRRTNLCPAQTIMTLLTAYCSERCTDISLWPVQQSGWEIMLLSEAKGKALLNSRSSKLARETGTSNWETIELTALVVPFLTSSKVSRPKTNLGLQLFFWSRPRLYPSRKFFHNPRSPSSTQNPRTELIIPCIQSIEFLLVGRLW